MYAEAVPGGNPIVLARPSLVASTSVGPGPIRGILCEPGVFSGATFAVSGGRLFRDASDLGSIGGAGRVTMAATAAMLVLSDGTSLYNYNGSSLTTASFPDGAPVQWLGRIGGYFVAIRGGDSQRFYWSADGVTWNALDFASAERKPDPLVGGLVIGDTLYLFGSATVEIFVQSDNADAIFVRLDQRSYPVGAWGRDTICLHDNTACWVTNEGLVVRDEDGPKRISTHSIEERIKSASSLDAWSFKWSGHAFYVLNIGGQGTFVCDSATSEWAEWGTYAETGWIAAVGCMSGTSVIVGSNSTGALYTLDDDVAEDATGVVQRIFAALAPVNKATPCHNLLIEASTGQVATLATAPEVEMRYSDDYGNTWGDWEAVSLGEQGEYRVQPVWVGLGLMDAPGRVFEFRLTDATPWRVSRVAINEDIRGKAR